MIRLVFLPLLAVAFISLVIYGGSVWLELSNTQGILAAGVGFCVLLTLYNHILGNMTRAKRREEWRSMKALENDLEARHESIDRKIDGLPDISLLERRVETLEEFALASAELKTPSKSAPFLYSEGTKKERGSKRADPEFDKDGSDNKIISLEAAARQKQEAERRNKDNPDRAGLPKGMTIENNFAVFLQPVLQLPEQDIFAVTALAGFYDAKSQKRHILRDGGQDLPQEIADKTGLNLVNDIATLMHLMKQEKEDVPVLLDMTPSILASQGQWNGVFSILKNDGIFRDNLLAGVRLAAYSNFTDPQKDRMSQLQEAGIKLAVTHCEGIVETRKAINSKQFSCVSASMSALLDYPPKNRNTLMEIIAPLAEKKRMLLIATEVRDDSHVMELMDADVKYAQGEFLSEPRLANIPRPDAGSNAVQN